MMKYELLNLFQNYLKNLFAKETVKTYTNRLDIILNGQSRTDILKSLNFDKILDNLANIKYKNHFSQSKNAFLHFCAFQNINLSEEVKQRMALLEDNTKKKHRRLKAVDFKQAEQRIKRIRNENLKLNFQTLTAIGIRVSELAGIIKEDCTITDNEINFAFVAKGGKKRVVILAKDKDPQLFERLKQLIEQTAPMSKVFLSANYLQKNAVKYNFTCHDLRRAFAKRTYKATKSKKAVKVALGHTSIKTTNIYLRSKVKI